jgi:putative ATP-dependent endonuclease of OLD family
MHDEPGGYEPAITVRLDVDSTLEPTWRVVTTSNTEGRIIGARDRGALGVAFIGASSDRQFTFTRGSALARAAGGGVDGILLEAYRQMRDAAGGLDLGGLDQVVGAACVAGTRMGAEAAADQLAAGLGVSRVVGAALALRAGGVLVAASGLGTRRLLALGLELLASPTGGIVCLDEIESGLEPHRLRHLMAALAAVAEGSASPSAGRGQVLFTSHSPAVVEELGARHLYTVRNVDGVATITRVPEDLTPVVRANAAALLCRRVIVAEGKTEIGLVRGHDKAWTARHGGQSLGFVGVAVADGSL